MIDQAAKIERIARAICWDRGMDPDDLVTSEVLYQVDDIKRMPSLPPFPAWQRYRTPARHILDALEAPE